MKKVVLSDLPKGWNRQCDEVGMPPDYERCPDASSVRYNVLDDRGVSAPWFYCRRHAVRMAKVAFSMGHAVNDRRKTAAPDLPWRN